MQRPEHLGLAYEHADLLQQRRSIRREDLPVALIPLQALANLFRDLEHVLLEGDRLERTLGEQDANILMSCSKISKLIAWP